MLYMYLDFLKAVSLELLAYCIERNAQQCPPFYPSKYEDLANTLLTKNMQITQPDINIDNASLCYYYLVTHIQSRL